jgi:enamine deaminase RidA (YjgF/YER057c/UK114 family)
MELKPVNPWKWQDAFGFSQAIEFSGHSRVLTCAGQTSVNVDGEPMHAGDMAAQLGQALDNVETVLKQAGMSLSNVVHLNLYTTDIDACLQHYAVVAERLGKANCRPAITLLQVARLFEPALMIEMEPTAVA